MLAMDRAGKERNGLLLVKHTHMHNKRPFIKTHHLMLTIKETDKERNRLLCMVHNKRPFCKIHLLMLAMEGADKERNRLLLLKHTHMQNTLKLTS